MVKKEVVRRDIILIACVLIAALAALLIINLTKQSGTVAVIYVNNEGKLHIRGERGSTCEMSIL